MDGASEHAPRMTRIDPPHAPVGGPAATSSEPSQDRVGAPSWLCPAAENSVAGGEAEANERQALQASQLAGHLRQKRQELDRRESQLNARHAQVDSQDRASRLWLRERQRELAERESRLAQREQEIQAEAARLTAAQMAVEQGASLSDQQVAERESLIAQARADLRRWEDRLHLRENAVSGAEEKYRRLREQHEQTLLQERQQWELERETRAAMIRDALRNLDRRAADLERREDALRRQESQRQAEEAHEARSASLQCRLEEADSLLRSQLAGLAQERRQWEAWQKLHDEQCNQRAQELAWRADAMSAALRRERGKLRERALALRQREAAIERVREETLQRHRQALELRLAVEQLWASLQGKAPPAELTRRLAQLRAEMARVENTAAAFRSDQHGQMRQLAERLDERKRELLDRQRELTQWAAARQGEIEEQAARLVAREQELDCQERQCQEAQRRWDDERRQYQRQIRELLARATDLPLAAL